MEELKEIQRNRKKIQGPFEPFIPGDTGESDDNPSLESFELALSFPGNPDDFKSAGREEDLNRVTDSESSPFADRIDGDETVSFWERGFWENRKISLAREVLVRLEERYRRIFKGQEAVFGEKGVEKENFFNSNLLYLIAITDGNEDTLGHSQLVSRYSVLFAHELGIEDRSFLIDLERGALLHDIGKIGIPKFVLRKDGPLTQREKEIVKEHPLLGYEAIKGFDFLKNAAEVILYHHERYDGDGYPFGLKGEEIPLGARIFALADTLDAITSNRPYKVAKSFGEALIEIAKGRDTQFDPYLTDAFLSIPKKKWENIRENSRITLPLSAVH